MLGRHGSVLAQTLGGRQRLTEVPRWVARTPWLVAMSDQDRTRTGVNEDALRADAQPGVRRARRRSACRTSSWVASRRSSTAARRGPTTSTCSSAAPTSPPSSRRSSAAGFERRSGAVVVADEAVARRRVHRCDQHARPARSTSTTRCSRVARRPRCGRGTLTVLGPEDLVVTKALAHGEETAHYWWDALAIVAGHELDWDYLLMRARRGPRRCSACCSTPSRPTSPCPTPWCASSRRSRSARWR